MRIAAPIISSALVIGAVSAVAVVAQNAPNQAPGGRPAVPPQPGPPGNPGAPLPILGPAPAAADDAVHRQQVSYAIGRDLGENLRSMEFAADIQALAAGISDALAAARPRFTDAELSAAMRRFEQEMQQKALVRMQQMAVKHKQAQDAFLAANKTKEGVQVTASGLQFKVLAQGNGPSPTAADVVRCHYRGTHLDGTEFDSSAGGPPVEFPVGRVIPGWTEALQKMHVGDRWELYVPTNLAYNDNPPPRSGIQPGEMLIFQIELVGIVER
jgi:FKBP-type peptidyl-prolyl cis-trans isomerase